MVSGWRSMKIPSLIGEGLMIGEGSMSRFRCVFSICLAAVSVAGSACSLTVESDRVQCKTDKDCSARGAAYAGYVCTDSMCEPDPTWACLDQKSSDLTPTGTVHVVLTTQDLLSQKPIQGVSLTLCAKLDANCQLPIAQYQSDQSGQIDVEMPAGFDGYFQTEGAGLYPMLFFPPSTRAQRAPGTLPMVANSFFGTMFSGVGGPVGSDRTVVMTTALDCLGKPAAGLALSSAQADDRTVGYVIQGGLPSRTAATTDDSGNGGFVNLPPGNAVITSTMAANNRLVGTIAVQTRVGHITMVLVMPNGI
jgi:hypothetical protein